MDKITSEDLIRMIGGLYIENVLLKAKLGLKVEKKDEPSESK